MTPAEPVRSEPSGPAIARGGSRVVVGVAVAVVAALVGVAVAVGAAVLRDEDAAGDAAVSAVGPASSADGDGGVDGVVGVPPFDPARPLDLGGVPGVTSDERARAERLVQEVGAAAAAYAEVSDAEAAGYVSVGDGFTGNEHFVDWSLVTDETMLDVDRPEALLYDIAPDGERVLAAMIFMGVPGAALSDVPEVGGSLTPWHLRGELCLDGTVDPAAVVAVTDAAGTCPPATSVARSSPALHVWVIRHPCGPFSSLEGVGSESLGELIGRCDEAHH